MSSGSDRDIIAQMYGGSSPDIQIPQTAGGSIAQTSTAGDSPDMKKLFLAIIVALALGAVSAGLFYSVSSSSYKTVISVVIGLVVAGAIVVASKFVLKW